VETVVEMETEAVGSADAVGWVVDSVATAEAEPTNHLSNQGKQCTKVTRRESFRSIGYSNN